MERSHYWVIRLLLLIIIRCILGEAPTLLFFSSLSPTWFIFCTHYNKIQIPCTQTPRNTPDISQRNICSSPLPKAGAVKTLVSAHAALHFWLEKSAVLIAQPGGILNKKLVSPCVVCIQMLFWWPTHPTEMRVRKLAVQDKTPVRYKQSTFSDCRGPSLLGYRSCGVQVGV